MDDLRQSIEIAAPIEKVWAELTRTNDVQRAMLDTVLDSQLKPGHPLKYGSRDGKRVFVVGRVVECDAPVLLSHTYRMTLREDPLTFVTWRLQPSASGTMVNLVHSGWTPESKRVDKTWSGILLELKHVVERGDVSTRTKYVYTIMRAFTFLMPSKTKAENERFLLSVRDHVRQVWSPNLWGGGW